MVRGYGEKPMIVSIVSGDAHLRQLANARAAGLLARGVHRAREVGPVRGGSPWYFPWYFVERI
jgi:hypothetical protein